MWAVQSLIMAHIMLIRAQLGGVGHFSIWSCHDSSQHLRWQYCCPPPVWRATINHDINTMMIIKRTKVIKRTNLISLFGMNDDVDACGLDDVGGQGTGGGVGATCLQRGSAKLSFLELKIVLGVIESKLSKVLSFAAQNSLLSVSKLSKSRIQVVGVWIVVKRTRKP